MDSRVTANFGPSIWSPAERLSNVVVIALPLPLLGPNRPAAAGTDYVARLVEEDVVVHDEQPFALDELVERAGLKPDHVARPRRDVVAPGLAGIDRARRAHPVVRRRAGEHQENMDRGRCDQPTIARGLG